jgi:hypothetical protein
MKVAFLAESPADAEAFATLAEAVLGQKIEQVSHVGLRHRGWPSVRSVLPAVIKQLHYHTDAKGLVFVVDSDYSPPHSERHELLDGFDIKCRLCQLRRITDDVCRKLSPRSAQASLKIALGLAVPAIEAWLLCGVEPHMSEAAWLQGLKEQRDPYTKNQLKEKLYGTSRPSLAVETEARKKAASRLAANLTSLGKYFPAGFGAFRDSLKNW